MILLVLAGNASGEVTRLPGHVERKQRLLITLGGEMDNTTRLFVEGARSLGCTPHVIQKDANCKSAIGAM